MGDPDHVLDELKEEQWQRSSLLSIPNLEETVQDERIVIVVEGGVVQNIMTDNPRSNVVCFLVDYDNLKGGQTEPPGEWCPELNPEEVELCATGEHPQYQALSGRESCPRRRSRIIGPVLAAATAARSVGVLWPSWKIGWSFTLEAGDALCSTGMMRKADISVGPARTTRI
jgi:hypothetical protein